MNKNKLNEDAAFIDDQDGKEDDIAKLINYKSDNKFRGDSKKVSLLFCKKKRVHPVKSPYFY